MCSSTLDCCCMQRARGGPCPARCPADSVLRARAVLWRVQGGHAAGGVHGLLRHGQLGHVGAVLAVQLRVVHDAHALLGQLVQHVPGAGWPYGSMCMTVCVRLPRQGGIKRTQPERTGTSLVRETHTGGMCQQPAVHISGLSCPFVCTGAPVRQHARVRWRRPARAQDLARPFAITYGTGEVTGDVATDTVTVGDSSAVTLYSQGFGQVLSSSSDFVTASCDGLFVRTPAASHRCPCLPVIRSAGAAKHVLLSAVSSEGRGCGVSRPARRAWGAAAALFRVGRFSY